jgi:hypothetical protein
MDTVPYQDCDEHRHGFQSVEVAFLVRKRIVLAETAREFDESKDDSHGDRQQTDVERVEDPFPSQFVAW